MKPMLNKGYVSPHKDLRPLLTNTSPEIPSGQYHARHWGAVMSEFGKKMQFLKAVLKCIT